MKNFWSKFSSNFADIWILGCCVLFVAIYNFFVVGDTSTAIVLGIIGIGVFSINLLSIFLDKDKE